MKRSTSWRKLAAMLRDTWLLMRQFGWPLLAYLILLVGGGSLYYFLARLANEPIKNIPEGIYLIWSMTILQGAGEFPRAWYLEIFYFLMPLLGLIIFAQGIAEFGVLFFNRRERGKEWEMAVASTFNKHIILVGLGHLGYRVVRDLHAMGQEVVAIEQKASADLVANVQRLGIPVIQDDAARDVALEAAGIRKARTIILCTQNDSLNLQVALKARRLHEGIHIVLRIFDDEFAQALKDQFGFTAFSATGMAAPAFAAAAAGMDMTHPITVEGETLSLARLKLSENSTLIGCTVAEVEQKHNVSVVFFRRQDESDLHPPASLTLAAGDALAVLGGPNEIRKLAENNPAD